MRIGFPTLCAVTIGACLSVTGTPASAQDAFIYDGKRPPSVNKPLDIRIAGRYTGSTATFGYEFTLEVDWGLLPTIWEDLDYDRLPAGWEDDDEFDWRNYLVTYAMFDTPTPVGGWEILGGCCDVDYGSLFSTNGMIERIELYHADWDSTRNAWWSDGFTAIGTSITMFREKDPDYCFYDPEFQDCDDTYDYDSGYSYQWTGKIERLYVNGTEVPLRWYFNNVPEPASWALMIAGFGLIGGMARRRRQRTPAEAYGQG